MVWVVLFIALGLISVAVENRKSRRDETRRKNALNTDNKREIARYEKWEAKYKKRREGFVRTLSFFLISSYFLGYFLGAEENGLPQSCIPPLSYGSVHKWSTLGTWDVWPMIAFVGMAVGFFILIPIYYIVHEKDPLVAFQAWTGMVLCYSLGHVYWPVMLFLEQLLKHTLLIQMVVSLANTIWQFGSLIAWASSILFIGGIYQLADGFAREHHYYKEKNERTQKMMSGSSHLQSSDSHNSFKYPKYIRQYNSSDDELYRLLSSDGDHGTYRRVKDNYEILVYENQIGNEYYEEFTMENTNY